jgi:hypothetical protein
VVIRIRLIPFIFVLLLAANATADEGMWPVYSLDKLDWVAMKSRGLTLEQNEIYSPGGRSLAHAVVSLGGGTGSFVSPNGLIITNHHVAESAIQRQSTVEQDYLRAGFLASTMAEEIPAPGYSAYVLKGVTDVTDRVLAALDDSMTDSARYEAVDSISKQIIRECEESEGIKCSVSRMFGGRQYMAYTYLQLRDVRIVYAPPGAIGNFGGEIDNWMWPRHTGDFAFLRAYVAPDGTPADYAEENVPYQTSVYLPVSSKGVSSGDFTMMIGFPGRTDRYASSYYLNDMYNYYYPQMIADMRAALEIMERAAVQDSAIGLRLASRMRGIQNYLKKSEGMVDGFARSGILDQRREQERLLMEFLAGDPDLMQQYGEVLVELDSLYYESMKTWSKDFALKRLISRPDYLDFAMDIVRWVTEREKEDLLRDRGYQDRDSTRLYRGMRTAQINLLPEIDRQLLAYYVQRALDLPADQRIQAIDATFSNVPADEREHYVEIWVDSIFALSSLGDLDSRLAMLAMAPAELHALNDPMIELATALLPEVLEEEVRSDEQSGAESRLKPKLLQAYADWKQGELYPDANGTMRFNYGEVTSCQPYDGLMFLPHTTMSGMMAKETGKDPFIVPEKLRQAYAAAGHGPYFDTELQDVPLCLLTNNDATNGNSGSPVVNGKGEFIGISFDITYESVTSDYHYDPTLSRSILTDARFILFMLDSVDGAHNILEELTIN